MEEYKSNSNRTRMTPKPEAKVEKIISGQVKTKKKGDIQKFTDVFISEDVGNIKSYIIMDILIPAMKKAISDIVTNGIDMVLYGEAGRTRRNSSSSSIASRINYCDRSSTRESRTSTRANGYDYDDIVFNNRIEAEQVLTRMDELIATYGVVSVADLYDLVGITGPYTNNKYGWSDLRSASVVRARDGYIIKLPKALSI